VLTWFVCEIASSAGSFRFSAGNDFHIESLERGISNRKEHGNPCSRGFRELT
jgi:hypothetical protein